MTSLRLTMTLTEEQRDFLDYRKIILGHPYAQTFATALKGHFSGCKLNQRERIELEQIRRKRGGK